MSNNENKRQGAVNSAVQANQKKMLKVKGVDNYWLKTWDKTPVSLTEEQLKEVNDFWSKYSFAYQNDPTFQEIYTYASGRFDPKYVPNGLNAYYMFRFYDDPNYHHAFHDKNYRDLLFHDFACTNAVVRRIKGYFYDNNYNKLSYDAAISRLEELINTTEEKLIVKPTPGGGGNGINFIRQGDTKVTISALLDSIKGDDIIIEKFMKAHSTYAAANPTSLNSLRIISFLYENEIEIIAVLFRMGAVKKEVDNFAQGGVACGVNPDGTCMDFGIDHFGNRYTVHPSGFEFAGHKLYGVEKAIELVKNLHWRVPQFKQMSWDIAVVEDGTPTLIEMNPRGDVAIYQSIGALPFGTRTEQILDDYLITMFFNLGANDEWDFKEYHNHIILTKYAGNNENVVVPEQINGKTVTHIENGCFTSNSIKTITIPGCVKSWSNAISTAKGDNAPKIEHLTDERNITVEIPVITSGVSENASNVICWNKTTDATAYYIYRMHNSKRSFVKAVSASVSSFADHNVLDGEKYTYYLRAHNSACNILSDWSKPSAIITKVD